MSLGTLIEMLEAEDQDLVLPEACADPHSYRGYYEDLALEPRENVRLGDLLAELKGCVGRMFYGYKGGEYTMQTYTTVWVAEYGCTSEDSLGPRLLRAWIDKAER